MPQLSRMGNMLPSNFVSKLWASVGLSTAATMRLGRNTVWDPRLIVSQIVCLQAWFYFINGSLLWLLLSDSRVMPVLFDSQIVDTMTTAEMWSLILVQMCSCAATAYMIYIVVSRARLCLDFAVTVYFLHLLFCCNYAQFPATFTWWLTNGVGAVISAVLSEYWCLQAEMAPVSFGSTEGSGDHRHRTGFIVRQQFDSQQEDAIAMQQHSYSMKKKISNEDGLDPNLEQQQFIV